MAITATVSNHFKYQLAGGDIDFGANTFTIILMNDSFAFDKDTHATLALVTASQLATENGYTQNTANLAGVTVTEDDTNDLCSITWNDVTWTATAADDATGIGPTGSCCIYDNTTADDTIVACIDFDTDYTISSGSSLQLQDLVINLT